MFGFDVLPDHVVHWVMPGMPAANAGLERGDWIIAVDGVHIAVPSLSGSRGSGRKLQLANLVLHRDEVGLSVVRLELLLILRHICCIVSIRAYLSANLSFCNV